MSTARVGGSELPFFWINIFIIMNIIITEQQYIKLIEDTQLSLFDDTVEDVCGQDIDYENFGFDKYYQRSYINLTDSTSDEREELYSRIKSSNCDIVLNNVITDEKFILNPDDIRITNTEHKKLYLPISVYEQKIFPYLPKIDKYERYVKSTEIKEALKRAFSKNWRGRTTTHIEGIVGILPIPNTKNQWSIVNFFNSKKSIINLIKLFLVRDYTTHKFIPGDNIKESVIQWMENLFMNIDGDDMKKLVKTQLKSIEKNFEKEYATAKLIRDLLHPGEKFYISGFGTIKDIERGIDVTIGNVTYQIKPFSNINFTDDSIVIDVGYSNANTYKIEDVNRMAFINGDKLYVFKNNGNPPINNKYEFNIKTDEKNGIKSELLYSPS